MSDEYADYSARKLKEWLNGNYNDDVDMPVSPEAGAIDNPEIQDLLRELRHAWDTSEWGRFEESDLYSRIAGAGMDRTVQRAVAHGHKPTLDRIMGDVDNKPDLSGYRAIKQIEGWMRDMPVFQAYIFAGGEPPFTGKGKTDFALFLSEIYEGVYPNAKFGSNITSTSDWMDKTTQKYSEMREWLENTEGRKMFILDEGSQDLKSNTKEGEAISDLLKLCRKHNASLLIIGHTGRDVARDVRRQMLCIPKISKKTAVIGHGLQEDNELITVSKEMLAIDGIPPTNREYWHKEESTFEMDIDADEETVEEPQQQCMAIKKSGGRCNADAEDGSQFCYNHRNWTGETVDPHAEEEEEGEEG